MKIQNTQTLDRDLTLNEVLEIEGELTLDPNKNITITTSKNIIVTGKLISRPSASVIHRIVFTAIDESKFVGGGESVLDSDTGMWVMNGQLDLQGALTDGWERPDNMQEGYKNMLLKAMTLTRNMRIEGTATGQSHLFIKSNKPQFIRYVQFRYMGPRKDTNGDGNKELVTGRYACHFHHSENGSRGSIIEGCIARDCNSHVFVPHGSHGIDMRNNIVYNVLETPFWYDLGHRTNDLVWEGNLVYKVGYVPRSTDQDSGGSPTFGAGGFNLGFGDGNKCNNNVVVATSGSTRQSGAFIWPEIRDDKDNTKQLETSWEFDGNTAINCPMGSTIWHNNNHHHIISNFTTINCPVPTLHGAYQNHYMYINCRFIGGTVDLRAASGTTNRIRFENVEFDAAGRDYCVEANEGPLNGVAPILFRDCKFLNWKKAAIIDQNPGPGVKNIDIINCNVYPAAVQVTATKSGETVRIQEAGKAWQVTRGGKSEIPIFAPTVWGTGTGLKAEYFSPDFKTKYLERIEPNVNIFDITHPQVHYAVPAAYAVRFTGKIEAQYNEAYIFYCKAGGGVRLSIDGKSIIDKWAERYPGEVTSSKVTLAAGKQYDFKLEFFNTDDRSGCTLEWASTSQKREFIPMSQLYPGVVIPDIPNNPPTAFAGPDSTIEVTAMLYGTGTDPEGKPVTYLWEQVKGTPAVIETPTKETTKVSSLSPGENVFRLTVTDEKGAKASDEVRVVVR